MARVSSWTVARSGFTPVTLKDVAAGRHALILEGDSGTLRRTVRVQAGERTVARYEITAGFLSVSSRDPARDLRRQPQDRHERRRSHPAGTRAIQGEARQHALRLSRGCGIHHQARRNLDAHGHAAARLATHHHRSRAPRSSSKASSSGLHRSPRSRCRSARAKYSCAIPQLGERRQSVDIVLGQPVDLSVILKRRQRAPRHPAAAGAAQHAAGSTAAGYRGQSSWVAGLARQLTS